MNWKDYASTINTVVATVAIVAGGIWGVWQYREEGEKQRAAQRFEAAKPFKQRQQDLCFEASDSASALAIATDAEHVAKALERFWQLYYGSLRIVEDTGPDSVADSMVKFGNLLQGLPHDPAGLAALEPGARKLAMPSLRLADSCARLIARSQQEGVEEEEHGPNDED
jgi:hypothetical protein